MRCAVYVRVSTDDQILNNSIYIGIFAYGKTTRKPQDVLYVDIPKPSLQNIEKGKRIVKEYEFYSLCKVLDISMEEMLKDFIHELD